MISFDEIELNSSLKDELIIFREEIEKFRNEGPLDKVALTKLEEHFKASHIYNSAGIEGNRLTLQETTLVLSDGIDISGKPVSESIEVKNLGKAFDYLKEISDPKQTLREGDIRDLHQIIVGENQEVSPGKYREIGVVISGSEHKPPEPLDVPLMVESLVNWINENSQKDPIIVASVAHHRFVYIHPFKDGNGRVSRLLMNLILMKNGYPISNISRDQRPEYYESLSFADNGLFDLIVQIVFRSSHKLFSEYLRIRDESKRAEEWAANWGETEKAVTRKRELKDLELWQTRVNQIYLEFERAADLLNEQVKSIHIEIYRFEASIDLEKYNQLRFRGFAEHANFFSIRFRGKNNLQEEQFMFRFYRNKPKFPPVSRFIPLELNYLEKDSPSEESKYKRVSELSWGDKIRIRELYFNEEGDFTTRYFDLQSKDEVESKKISIADTAKMFFDDVLKNIFTLS